VTFFRPYNILPKFEQMFCFCSKGIAIGKRIAYYVNTNICSFSGGEYMSLITILLGIGICGFLAWFFEAILKDIWADEDGESEVYYLHSKRVRKDPPTGSYAGSTPDEVIVTRHPDVA